MRITTLCYFLVASAATAAVDFSHQVVPILKQHCGECHLGDKKKGGFSMNTKVDLIKGSENGEVYIAGKADRSLLIEVLLSTDKDKQMPPKGARVPADQIAILKQWINEGVSWEEGFTFGKSSYEPPLKPRRPTLPAPSAADRTHPIDRIIDAYLLSHKKPIPAAAELATLQRRMHLDLIGILPGEGASPQSPEQLLARDVDYAEHWLSFWNDLLRNDYVGTGYIDGGRKPISTWLYHSLVTNKPFDQFARELLSPTPESEGFIFGIKWRGNVNASQVREVQFAQSISQVFLGINMKCASCHDSFIDRWKLDEAYSLAAVYADAPMEVFRCDKPTGRKAQAAWIFPELGSINASAAKPERLKQLAALMTHPDNGRFTRTIANRLWHRLMGHGIVHPVDAMHTEPWSADLLDYLATYLSDNGYDLKKLLLHITTSKAYQSQTSTAPAEQASAHFVYSGPIARRLTAEQFLDAVWTLTGTHPATAHPSVIRGKPDPKAKATAQWIWSSPDTTAPDNAAITLRKVFKLDENPSRGVAIVTADNAYELYVNNRQVIADDNLATVESASISNLLKKGNNTITLITRNGGKRPNPAAAFFEAKITLASGKVVSIASDATWEWNAKLPVLERKALKPLTEGWQPAALASNQSIWASQTETGIRSAIAQASGASAAPVRASLVISDLLQRSLGRPNREQIVSVRPDNLTTLEAIDLANGSILADLLKRGASTVANQYPQPDALIQHVFAMALSRQPSPSELTAAISILPSKPEHQAVEDLLWSILVLPEFQFVR